ncbi:hypothetical protein DFJ74DRAFT_753717 [Hyaloraphidium curvatum]|nr:hypothetical protein DFJ74DRAFT_753717 [Hyaloraphidium curvatum]
MSAPRDERPPSPSPRLLAGETVLASDPAEEPERLPIVLLHGMRLTGTQFRPVLRAREFGPVLAGGHDVATPDIPGHGRSAQLDYSVERTARVVAEALGESYGDKEWEAEKERWGKELNPFRPYAGRKSPGPERASTLGRKRSADGISTSSGSSAASTAIASITERVRSLSRSLPRGASFSSLLRSAADAADAPRPESTPPPATLPAVLIPGLAVRAATEDDPLLAQESFAAELASLDPPPPRGPRRHVLAGTSLGSFMALASAFLRPDAVAGLVLMNGGFNPTYPLSFPYLAFTTLMSTWSDAGYIRKLYDRGLEGYVDKGRTREEVEGVMEGGSFFKGAGEAVSRGVLGWDYVAMAAAFVEKTKHLYPQTATPTGRPPRKLRILLMNGANDALFLMHEPAYVRALSAPHTLVSAVRIPNSGHLSFLDNPPFVAGALARFVARVQEEEEAGCLIARDGDGEELREVRGEGAKPPSGAAVTQGDKNSPGMGTLRRKLEKEESEAAEAAAGAGKAVWGREWGDKLRGWLGLPMSGAAGGSVGLGAVPEGKELHHATSSAAVAASSPTSSPAADLLPAPEGREEVLIGREDVLVAAAADADVVRATAVVVAVAVVRVSVRVVLAVLTVSGKPGVAPAEEAFLFAADAPGAGAAGQHCGAREPPPEPYPPPLPAWHAACEPEAPCPPAPPQIVPACSPSPPSYCDPAAAAPPALPARPDPACSPPPPPDVSVDVPSEAPPPPPPYAPAPPPPPPNCTPVKLATAPAYPDQLDPASPLMYPPWPPGAKRCVLSKSIAVEPPPPPRPFSAEPPPPPPASTTSTVSGAESVNVARVAMLATHSSAGGGCVELAGAWRAASGSAEERGSETAATSASDSAGMHERRRVIARPPEPAAASSNMRRPSFPALALAAALAASAPAAQAQQAPALRCVANIATQVNFTLSTAIAVDAILVGGGGGGSGYNGRGGGGGSSAIDFGTTHVYAAGGHGGYSSGDGLNYWNGYPGQLVQVAGLKIPAGVPVTITVGGGGGAGNDYCQSTLQKGDPCPQGGGGGGAGAYGGGGGASDGGSDSGGGGGEAGGARQGGNAGGEGNAGSQWAGGKGQGTSSGNCNQALNNQGQNQVSNCGGDGGAFFLGSQLATTAGSGGGFGSGGGSSAYQYHDGGAYFPLGGTGGSNGGAGGPSRTGTPNSANYATGPDLAGAGACSFPPGIGGAVPSAAGRGGSGANPGLGGLGGVSEEEGSGTVSGGNAGYVALSYASPDGVSCPIPSQAQPAGVGGNYCVF